MCAELETTVKSRVNYDLIAHQYDGQPYRQKAVDPDLLAFLAQRKKPLSEISILDMGCGTGNQLAVHRPILPAAMLVGLDLFHGMLRQAVPKSNQVHWVRGDNAAPPFPDRSFDVISNQFSFHHVRDQHAMIYAVARLLRPGGLFIMDNICPRRMPDWVYYRYFPDAYPVDLRDFMPVPELAALLEAAGFVEVHLAYTDIDESIDLRKFLESIRDRLHCSQLIALSDVQFHSGVQRIVLDIEAAGGETAYRQSRICLLRLRAKKP